MYARVRGLWRSWPLLLWRMIHLGLKATWRAETTHNWPLYNLWLTIKSKSIQNRTHEIHKIITPVLVWIKLAHPTYIFSRVLRNSTPRYVGLSVGWFAGPLFGQQPQRGRSPVKHRGLSFVHPSVHPFICLFVPPPRPREDFRPERADFRPERADFRPERAWGGTDRQTDGQMDRRTNKSSLCSTGLCPLWGRCPASHSNSQPCKAGQWVSLTTYCP